MYQVPGCFLKNQAAQHVNVLIFLIVWWLPLTSAFIMVTRKTMPRAESSGITFRTPHFRLDISCIYSYPTMSTILTVISPFLVAFMRCACVCWLNRYWQPFHRCFFFQKDFNVSAEIVGIHHFVSYIYIYLHPSISSAILMSFFQLLLAVSQFFAGDS